MFTPRDSSRDSTWAALLRRSAHVSYVKFTSFSPRTPALRSKEMLSAQSPTLQFHVVPMQLTNHQSALPSPYFPCLCFTTITRTKLRTPGERGSQAPTPSHVGPCWPQPTKARAPSTATGWLCLQQGQGHGSTRGNWLQMLPHWYLEQTAMFLATSPKLCWAELPDGQRSPDPGSSTYQAVKKDQHTMPTWSKAQPSEGARAAEAKRWRWGGKQSQCSPWESFHHELLCCSTATTQDNGNNQNSYVQSPKQCKLTH